jgi:hypothetical protein
MSEVIEYKIANSIRTSSSSEKSIWEEAYNGDHIFHYNFPEPLMFSHIMGEATVGTIQYTEEPYFKELDSGFVFPKRKILKIKLKVSSIRKGKPSVCDEVER